MNNIHPVLTYDSAIAHIDEEIARLKSKLFNLYSQRNSHSFFCRLPIETLETIFIHCVRDYHSEGRGGPNPTLPSWVNVSYVCRHWRHVALNCPTLWTYLFVMSPRWTEELLARSKQVSLKLHLNLGFVDRTYRGSHFAEQVMNHVERIRELSLDLPGMRTDEVFTKLCSRAPRLKHLKITVYDTFPKWSSVLFHGDTPALRTLELTECPVPYYSFTLSGLTTLSLHHVPVELQQSMVDFLPTLSRMQGLTFLCLKHALASAVGFLPSSAFNSFQKINLPHLSRLLFAAPLSTVIAFLSCVHIPLQAEVRLECHSESSSSLDDYTLLSSLLARRFSTFEEHAPSSPTIRSLVIDSAQWGKTIFTLSTSQRDCDPSQGEWGCNIPLRIVVGLSSSMSRSDGDRILADICRSIPPTPVQSLHVLYPPRSSAFWMHTLGHLQDLRYLKLSHGEMPDLASILSFPPQDRTLGAQSGQADRGLDGVFAPALEELELYDILLSTAPPTNDPQSLSDALSTRKETRGRLIMKECAVTATYTYCPKLDMVGRWEDGHFYVIESA
ncbi:hypothetical protein V8E55_001532 [Tylopilus felleus]